MNTSKTKRVGAFSLIELSIVILIISIIAGAALTIFNSKNIADKNRETRARLEKIAEAMKIYYKKNGALPCPAALNAEVNNWAFGYGNYGGGPCVAATATYSALVSGGVPIVELNLGTQYTFDSWGNRIIYVVSGSYTSNPWPSTTYSQSELQIKDKAGNLISQRYALGSEIGTSFTDCVGTSLAPAAYTDYIGDCPPMLLLSTGANGFQSYNFFGSGPKNDTFGKSTYEVANAALDGYPFNEVFIDGDLNQDMKDVTFANYFDDIMVYKSVDWFKMSDIPGVVEYTLSGVSVAFELDEVVEDNSTGTDFATIYLARGNKIKLFNLLKPIPSGTVLHGVTSGATGTTP